MTSLSTVTPALLRAAPRLRRHLERLYPSDVAAETHRELLAMLAQHVDEYPTGAPREPQLEVGGRRSSELFDETDVILITYGDQVTQPGAKPLATLADFLERRVADVISGVHVLPFYPSTSDDGFAVADYDEVAAALGDWGDIERLARRFRLMVDAVFNHVSASNRWFKRWRAGDPQMHDFFVTVDPTVDLSMVTRPRHTPLLTPVETAHGVRAVWTTFSADQVDLNYANPQVLLAVTSSLLGYVRHGAGIVRLDAIAYLWKQLGTSCIHLERTHEVVRLWRTVLDAVAPGTLLITETNVPHEENVSYFGDGTNEAHLVYQFPLAPLVLSTFHLADTRTLREWASTLSTPSPTTTFFNFLSSHDGIGVRPAEGLLTRSEIAQLGDLARAHGGGVSSRVTPDGSLAPYELNTVLFDALTPADTPEPLTVQVDRFLSAQSILLSMAGVPALYFHTLVGSRNWHEGVEKTGRLRSINRKKFTLDELEGVLADPRSRQHQVFTRLLNRIRIRIAEPAFHPNAPQRLLETPPAIFGLQRVATDGSGVACLHNVSGRPQHVVLDDHRFSGTVRDLMTGTDLAASASAPLDVHLPPYGVVWLKGTLA